MISRGIALGEDHDTGRWAGGQVGKWASGHVGKWARERMGM